MKIDLQMDNNRLDNNGLDSLISSTRPKIDDFLLITDSESVDNSVNTSKYFFNKEESGEEDDELRFRLVLI